MQKVFLLAISFIYGGMCFAQKQKTIIKKTDTYTLRQTTAYYKLGNRSIGIVTYKYNNNPGIVMISLHDDEATAIETSKQVLRKTGGYLIKINNDSTRLISFKLNGLTYKFDPNRIFTQTGIAATLKKQGRYSPAAAVAVKNFAKFILSKIPSATATLIALHNNHVGDYSIYTYAYGVLMKDKREIYIDSIHVADNFFITTDDIIYNKIRGFGYNVALQNNSQAKDDGSLSIYYGKKNKSYVNVEALHGKPEVQFNMLMTVINTPKRKNDKALVYNYTINDSIEENSIKNLKVYFGNKQIGSMLSAYYAQAYKKVIGQVEIEKGFGIYSNSDLFLLKSNNVPQMEIRIDPTRERKPFDRLKETIGVVMGQSAPSNVNLP